MRFLIASSFVPQRHSGAAGSLFAIGDAHRRRGHQVDWLWMPPEGGSRMWNELVRIPGLQANDIGAFLRRHNDVDAVFISQPYAYQAFERLKPKHPDVLFINRTHGWEPRSAESQHRYGWDSALGAGRRLLRDVSRWHRSKVCRRAVLAADGVVAACRQDADWIRARYELPEWRVACIPYGIAADKFPRAPRREATSGPLRLIYAGKYQERKGSKLLESVLPPLAAEFPDAQLSFVVLPEQVPLVEQAYGASWGRRLRICSWMPQRDLFDEFSAHDVLLFPSYFEGFGKVAIEAMAMGCVPVGFDEAAMSDLTSEGVLTCPHGDAEAFAALLRDLLGGQVAWQRSANRAMEIARGRTWDTVAAEEETFLRNLSERRGEVAAR